MTGNKNVRLSFEAWNALRNLKFRELKPTYTDVFQLLFDKSEGVVMEDHLKSKSPEDIDKEGKFADKSDKTIVINTDMHRKLTEFKIEYMTRTGSTARGKNAVSISDIVLTLIKNFQTTQ